MRKKSIFQEKAVLGTLLCAFVLLSTTSIIPATHGSIATDNIEKINQFKTNYEFGKEIDKNLLTMLLFENFKKLNNNILPGYDIPIDYEILDIFYDFLGTNEISFGNFKTIMSKISLLKNELSKLRDNEISINDLSADTYQLFERIDEYISADLEIPAYFDNTNQESNDIITEEKPSNISDFDNYMTYYDRIVIYWSLFGADNMREFINVANWFEWFIVFLTIFFFVFSLYIMVFVEGGESIAFILITAATLFDVLITYFDIRIHACWHVLDVWSTQLNMRNIRVITDGEPQEIGIDDLDGYIRAYNVDIKESNKYAGLLEEFTYALGAMDGADEEGWYSLSNWWKAEDSDYWVKTPMPPGRWHIEFDKHLGYMMDYIDGYRIPTSLDGSAVYTLTYQIDTNPSTPEDITVLGDTEVHVGQKVEFSTKGYDPDPNDTVYFKFHWGDTEGEWSKTSIPSGTTYTTNHTWTIPGCYEVKVKSMDNTERMDSVWSNVVKILVLP
jgi:hypothetical protein